MVKIVVIVAIYLWIIGPAMRESSLAKKYTHRGLYSKDQKIKENSLESFQLAIEQNYGIELDVRMTKDEKLIIYHDPNFKRLHGKDIDIENHTLYEIEEEIKERCVLLKDVLNLVNGKVDLMFELKPQKEYRKMAEIFSFELDGYQGNFSIESFDPRIVLWFRFHRHHYNRGLLVMNHREYKKHYVSWVWTSLMLNFLLRPDYISIHVDMYPLNPQYKLFQVLGGKVVAWTVKEDIDKFINESDAIIFE